MPGSELAPLSLGPIAFNTPPPASTTPEEIPIFELSELKYPA